MTNERLTDERLKYADEAFDAYFAKPAETQKLVRELVAEIDALRQERHTLRNELTAARLENERLQHDLERAVANHVADLNSPAHEPSALPSELHVRGCGAWRGEACTCIQPAVRINV